MASLENHKLGSTTPNPFDPDILLDSGNRSESVALSRPSELPVAPNPWEDGTTSTVIESEIKRIPSLDSSIYDQRPYDDVQSGVSTPKNDMSKVEILNEFDPLASLEEKAARDAWADSEGHPPPPPPPQPRTPSPPLPPLKDLYISSPASPDGSSPIYSPGPSATAISSPTPFASFASFAKNLTLPLVKSMPQSFEGSAKAVPSPSTLSSFASQQDSAKSEAPDTENLRSSSSGASTPNRGMDNNASSSSKPNEPTFDFQRFLDQMKTRSAEPVSRYLRSFLSNFAKRTFTVNDQVKITGDFLTFISGQMRECDVWRNCSDAEFDNAMEGMEKLVMNRLYDFTFTPQLEHADPPRPITTDDLERDRVLSQRIALFDWVEEKHLDVPEGEGSKGFLMFAQQELVKINHYKAPRDKLICILNCCKVIFGLLRHLSNEENADSFLPILIFVVLKANPEHLLSNVEFINRFRNATKLQSEAGYYLSSLMGAVSFIETMDHTSLSSITQEEFEKNVEKAIQQLPSEPHSPTSPFGDARRNMNDFSSAHAGEESARPLAMSTPSISEDAKRLLQKTGDTISKPLNAIGRIFSEALDGAENKLSYLPAPFAPFELGRDTRSDPPELGSSRSRPQRPPPLQWHPDGDQLTPHTPYNHDGPNSAPIQTPYKQRIRKTASPSYSPSSAGHSPGSAYSPYDTPSRPGPYTNQPLIMGSSQPIHPGIQNSLPPRVQSLAAEETHISRTPTPALDFAGVQAQIDLAHEHVSSAAKATLRQIFPAVDVEVIDWVLEANEGDLGKSIEQLLEIGGSDD